MEQMAKRAFASQKSTQNKRLTAIIARVENKYGICAVELDDEKLGLVSAAGELNCHLPKEDDGDE